MARAAASRRRGDGPGGRIRPVSPGWWRGSRAQKRVCRAGQDWLCSSLGHPAVVAGSWEEVENPLLPSFRPLFIVTLHGGYDLELLRCGESQSERKTADC